jgi:hypothetical protein
MVWACPVYGNGSGVKAKNGICHLGGSGSDSGPGGWLVADG